MNKNRRFTGLIAAGFTPMHDSGELNLAQIAPIVDQLVNEQVNGFFVCGSTGEGPSLTIEERKQVAAVYVEASAGRVPIIVHVGHNSLKDSQTLATHAQDIGADAVSLVPPSYFKPKSIEVLVSFMAEVAACAPNLPFYYYHIPGITDVNIDVVELLRVGSERISSMAGIKYSKTTVYELQACVDLDNGRFNVLFGSDEMLLSGLCGGAHGAIGSTYNFAAPLFNKIINAFDQNNIAEAQRLQGLAVQMVQSIMQFDAQPGLKATMKLVGLDCGPNRLPLVALKSNEVETLHRDMEEIGFFDWGR
jgi:N-acetylneuraminate lyase